MDSSWARLDAVIVTMRMTIVVMTIIVPKQSTYIKREDAKEEIHK